MCLFVALYVCVFVYCWFGGCMFVLCFCMYFFVNFSLILVFFVFSHLFTNIKKLNVGIFNCKNI